MQWKLKRNVFFLSFFFFAVFYEFRIVASIFSPAIILNDAVSANPVVEKSWRRLLGLFGISAFESFSAGNIELFSVENSQKPSKGLFSLGSKQAQRHLLQQLKLWKTHTVISSAMIRKLESIFIIISSYCYESLFTWLKPKGLFL